MKLSGTLSLLCDSLRNKQLKNLYDLHLKKPQRDFAVILRLFVKQKL